VKVKIKMNVPKPPTGMPGVTFFGSCYKWKDVFYRMGEEYTINKADFNPAIMVSLEPPKKKKAKKIVVMEDTYSGKKKDDSGVIIHPVAEEAKTEEEVLLNLADGPIHVPTEDTPILINTSDEIETLGENTAILLEKPKERKHRKR